MTRRLSGGAPAALALVLATTACGLFDDGGEGLRSADRSSAIETQFTKIGPQGFIDLSLDLDNSSDRPVVMSGRLAAVD